MRDGRLEEGRLKALTANAEKGKGKTVEAASAFCRLCGCWRGELGLEPTPDCGQRGCGACFVCHIVEVFREVRRVLRKDGTLWLNIGSSYASAPNGRSAAATKANGADDRTWRDKPTNSAVAGFKPKDLIGMPWMIALALQSDGWWLRSDVIWSKKNPLPSSVKDRPATSHEYLFLFAKRERYFYDSVAVREPAKQPNGLPRSAGRQAKQERLSQNKGGTLGTNYGKPDRNLRTVWEISTEPLSAKRFGADVEHFAAFPRKLVEPCILAGTSAHGCCARCGAPWERVAKQELEATRGRVGEHKGGGTRSDPMDAGSNHNWSGGVYGRYRVETLGWRPTCRCRKETGELPAVVPCRVLDPFAGSATVGVVALQHGRDFVGCDLSHDYLAGLAAKRIAHSLTAPARRPKRPRAPREDQLALRLE